MTCLTDEDLADVFAGGVTERFLAAAYEHCGSCDACRELLALAARMRAVERHDVESTPSDVRPLELEADLWIGRAIGRFRILRWLGEGGMGVVFAGLDEELNRTVAIKLIRSSGGDADRDRARLLREARAIACVHHANVVTVHEVGVHDGRAFIVMDFVDGSDLRVWLRRRTRTWAEIVDAWIAVGEGLAAIHARGLAHRDLKPENVLVHENGRVQVTDFGLVGDAGGPGGGSDCVDVETVLGRERTEQGAVFGTPRYMAPEQLAGHSVTAASDQFAYCVSLWESLTGNHPFGADPEQRHRAQATATIVDSSPDRTTAPPAVIGTLRRGLAFAPEQRYRSMDELLGQLRRARELPARRRRAIAVSILGVGAIGVGLLLGSVGRRNPSCAEVEHGDFAGRWDTARRERVLAMRATTDSPDELHRITGQLDEYTGRWSDLRLQACEATRLRGEVSEDMLDRRMACLSSRRASLSTVVDLLEDPTITDSVALVGRLPALAPCENLQALSADVARPQDPSTAQRVLELEAELAAAHVLGDAGRSTDARAKLDGILAAAERIDWPPLHTRALLMASWFERESDPVASLSTWRRAFAVSTRAGAAAGFEAAIEGIDVYARVNDLDEAEFYAEVAAEQAELLDGEPYPGDLEINRGMLAARRGDLPRAEQHLRSAFVAAQTDSERRWTVMNLCLNLGAVLGAQGKLDDARIFSAHAVALAREIYGEAHPSTLRAEINEATVDFAAGAFAEVERTTAAVIARYAVLQLPGEEAVALSLRARALSMLERDCVDPAGRAVDLRRDALAPDDPLIARSLGILATCLSERGGGEQALEALDEAFELLRDPGADRELVAELESIRAAVQERY